MTSPQAGVESASAKAFGRLEPSKHGPLPERQSPWRSGGLPAGA